MQPKNWAQSVAVAHLRARARRRRAGASAAKRASLVQSAGHAESPAVLAATEQATRATVAWVTAPIGRTAVAWRADSARSIDTPLIDFILEVERTAAGADLASAAAFSLDASIDTGAITHGSPAGTLPVRQHAARHAHQRPAAARIPRAQRALLPRPTSSGDRRPSIPTVPGYNFDIVAGADYTLDLSRPQGERVTRLEFRGPTRRRRRTASRSR